MHLRLLRHPIQAAKSTKSKLSAHIQMRTFAYHGWRRFRGDARYDLRNVTDGFISRIDDGDDTEILERICAAYNKAAEREESAPNWYRPCGRWLQVRLRNLGPVINALRTRDIHSLRTMYRNFYREACSAGILGAPNGNPKAYFSARIGDLYRHFYLSHVLYRLDYWQSMTGSKFALGDLAGPGVGNPFGVVIDGTHISVGAEYSHYCSQRVQEEYERGRTTIAEIRGGFGGIAYYLLRDRPETTYVDLDYPESIALASYYLMKAFPDRKFLCYGEKSVTRESIADASVVMLPVFELTAMPAGMVTMTFTSHGLADLAPTNVSRYLKDICRITEKRLLLISNKAVSESALDTLRKERIPFEHLETRESGWHSYKVSGAGVGGRAGLSAKTVLEQSYRRTGVQDSSLAPGGPVEITSCAACTSVRTADQIQVGATR